MFLSECLSWCTLQATRQNIAPQIIWPAPHWLRVCDSTALTQKICVLRSMYFIWYNAPTMLSARDSTQQQNIPEKSNYIELFWNNKNIGWLNYICQKRWTFVRGTLHRILAVLLLNTHWGHCVYVDGWNIMYINSGLCNVYSFGKL